MKKLFGTVSSVITVLSGMIFGTEKTKPFLQHVLMKNLASDSRQNLRKNLTDGDMIVYSDFSKG